MGLKHQAPRGTRDLLPGETERWEWVESRARGVLARHGYREIRTPVFEDFELFARTSGESSEVVQKEMYRFKDLKGRDLALRPENTAGVCRAYLENSLASQGRVHRLWYMGPMFRYGRPQKGRYRQFSQIGAELIGTPAPGADVEMIALFVALFEAWGLANLTVAINSVGTTATRRTYGERLRTWLAPVLEKLSADSRQRLEVNPMRVLDTKDEGDLALLGGAGGIGPMPRMLDALEPDDRMHFDAVVAGLDTLGIAHELDHGLVRGLDYYTRTAFEVHDRSLGAQSALGGGGRYDGLIEELGGRPTPGVGFSIGLDRTLQVLEQAGRPRLDHDERIMVVYVESTMKQAMILAGQLRNVFPVDIDVEGRPARQQMGMADKLNARFAILFTDEAAVDRKIVFRDLEKKTEILMSIPDVLEFLMHRHLQTHLDRDKKSLEMQMANWLSALERSGETPRKRDRLPGTSE